MKKLVNFLFIVLLFCFSTRAFETLKQAEAYAQLNPEVSIAKEQNILRPDYEDFYVQRGPSLISDILTPFKDQLWSPTIFKDTLQTVVQEREQKGYYGKFILIKTPKPGTQFIVIGPLFGTFHSLVRNLKELEVQGFINNNLEVIKPNCFIIFNGNVINGAPHVLETLTLVLSLMEKNPHAVKYIRGLYENELYWQNTTLKSQLKLQARRLSNENIPFARLLTRFFKTLPLGIYLNSTNPQEGLLRISYFSLEDNVFLENSCMKELLTYRPSMTVCRLKTAAKSEERAPVRAIIKGENRLISYEQNPGLTLLEPERGATAWSVLSSPNKIYREHFSFFYDAFSIITIGPTLADTTITLYHQDVRDLISFRRAMTYNLLTGQALLRPLSTQPAFEILFAKKEVKVPRIEEKVPETLHITDTIRLGSTMDLSKSNQLIGKSMKAGISALVNRVNQSGGINGKLYQVTIVDDQYNPTLSHANIEKFLHNNIKFILCPVGTPTLSASLDLIKEKKIFVLFPNSGSLIFRKPDLTNIVHFRPSYETEAVAITYHMIKNLASKRFAFFYQNDSYGRSALDGALKVLKKEGLKEWIDAPYLANTVQVNEAVNAIRKGLPDSIGFFSNVTPTIELIRQLGSEFLAGRKLFAISPVGERSFKQFVRSSGLEVSFAQVVPNPATSDLQIVQEYRQEIAKQALAPDTYALEGYIAASLTANYFRRIKGPITFEALLKLIEGTKNYKFKGLTLNFDPQTRALAHYLWIEQPNGEWVEQNLNALESINESTTQ